MRRNVRVKTMLSRLKNLQIQEELRAARPELTWICDRLALANDRWSQSASTTWCAYLDVCDELSEYSSDAHVN